MLTETTYPCKIDASMQPALVQFARGEGAHPLVVVLHTWSYHCDRCNHYFEGYSIPEEWHIICPDFRGPNWSRQACCSEYVVSDIEDAVSFMKLVAEVDENRIYLMGGSGGGHCALYMAGRRPDLWTAVSAWCPISDILAWHEQCKGGRSNGYAEHIETLLGGNPMENPDLAQEARMRSPLTWLQNAQALPIDISTGIHDGHTGSVPVSQAINAYNLLADPERRIRQSDIDYIVEQEAIPEELQGNYPQDSSYIGRKILLRKQSRNVRLTLFEGTHEIFAMTAFQWLGRQIRGKKSEWSSGTPITPATTHSLLG